MSGKQHIIPPKRVRYLSEIVEVNRGYDQSCKAQAELAQKLYGSYLSLGELSGGKVLLDKNGVAVESMTNEGDDPSKEAVVNTLLNSDQPVSEATLAAIDQSYRSLGGDILGLVPAELRSSGGEEPGAVETEEELIRFLIELRDTARKNKEFATSDAIRDRLAGLGITLEDRPDGTIWKISRS